MKFGLFPDRLPGGKVASISFSLTDTVGLSAEFVAVDQGLKVTENRQSVVFSPTYECHVMPSGSECNLASRGKEGPTWFFERLNQLDGGGFFLDNDEPSGKIVTALQRAQRLGTLIAYGPFDNKAAWSNFYQNVVGIELYFEQESREVNLRSVCTRTLSVDVKLTPSEQADFDTRSCDSQDLCFDFQTKGNLDVELCEPSRL